MKPKPRQGLARSRRRGGRPGRRGAFTLIELLVVVAIIALLITILVPAVGHARLQAKRARTAAQIQVIATALDAIANDLGDYPPSDPFSGDPAIDPNYLASGAHLLAYYLVGDPNGNMPAGIKKPYMSVDKANAIRDDIPRPQDKVPAMNPSYPGGKGFFVLRDVSFGGPILYYKANRRAKFMNDPLRYACAAIAPAGTLQAAYYLSDNGMVTGLPNDTRPAWMPSPMFKYQVDVTVNLFADLIEAEGTRSNVTIPISARAQNADGFLLLTPGTDYIYGWNEEYKCDDIGNFTVPQRTTRP